MVFEKLKNKKSGFTIIEALIVLFILTIVVVSFYSIIALGTKNIIEAKNRMGALALANEKMEIVRNLKYNDIGVKEDDDVEGVIPGDEYVNKNTQRYHVHTNVEYVLDPDDDTGGDEEYEDYKQVIITVAWGTENQYQSIQLSSFFAPKGLEVYNPNDGILSIKVIDDAGIGVKGSTVYVANPITGLNSDEDTDDNGNVIFVGGRIQKDLINKYEIKVAKTGYETVYTYPQYPESPFYPKDVHASVVGGSTNLVTIIQNRLSDLKFNATDYSGENILPTQINFHLKGGRQIANDPLDIAKVIYNIDVNANTDATGKKEFLDISPGQFELSNISVPSEYEFIESEFGSNFSLLSGVEMTVRLKLADKNETGVLFKLISAADSKPITNATIEITNGSGFSLTKNTSSSGVAYVDKDSITEGTYNIKITADGFAEVNKTIDVSDKELLVDNNTLTAQ